MPKLPKKQFQPILRSRFARLVGMLFTAPGERWGGMSVAARGSAPGAAVGRVVNIPGTHWRVALLRDRTRRSVSLLMLAARRPWKADLRVGRQVVAARVSAPVRRCLRSRARTRRPWFTPPNPKPETETGTETDPNVTRLRPCSMTMQVNSVDVAWVGLPVPGGRMLRCDNVLAARPEVGPYPLRSAPVGSSSIRNLP
jgi:hypothetical protein